uniref:Uncharacterized protein n=1 Tax=Glossina palpalis gambiensis TaxID=67801 RepID=A0A1B0BQ97_9MUSC
MLSNDQNDFAEDTQNHIAIKPQKMHGDRSQVLARLSGTAVWANLNRNLQQVEMDGSNGNRFLTNVDDFLAFFEIELYKIGIYDYRKIFEPATTVCRSDQLCKSVNTKSFNEDIKQKRGTFFLNRVVECPQYVNNSIGRQYWTKAENGQPK